jgi:hypothetical protein
MHGFPSCLELSTNAPIIFITCAISAENACFDVSYVSLTSIKIIQVLTGLSMNLFIVSEQKQTTANMSWTTPPKTPKNEHSLSIYQY